MTRLMSWNSGNEGKSVFSEIGETLNSSNFYLLLQSNSLLLELLKSTTKSEQSGSVHAYYSKQTVNSAMFLDEKGNL